MPVNLQRGVLGSQFLNTLLAGSDKEDLMDRSVCSSSEKATGKRKKKEKIKIRRRSKGRMLQLRFMHLRISRKELKE